MSFDLTSTLNMPTPAPQQIERRYPDNYSDDELKADLYSTQTKILNIATIALQNSNVQQTTLDTIHSTIKSLNEKQSILIQTLTSRGASF